MNYNVVWKPLPGSQSLSLSCPCNEILYEGTRGPGKTAAQLARFRRNVGVGYGSFWRGVIFDTEYKNLADIITQSKRMYRLFKDGARFLASASELRWVWPTGEELLFRFGKEADDYWDYHGQEFPFIGFNELTKQKSADFYEAMFSCRRSSFRSEDYPLEDGTLLKPIPLETFSTTNPFGIGHTWVKKRFIEPAPRGTIIRETQKVFNPQTKKDEDVTLTRVAIHGSFKENPYLDPQYVAKGVKWIDQHLAGEDATEPNEIKQDGKTQGQLNIMPGICKKVLSGPADSSIFNGEKYLPHPADRKAKDDPHNERYKRYLLRASFINATGRTLLGLLGITFNKPVKIDIAGGIEYLETDINGEGQPLTQMIRDSLSQVLQRGRAGLLTDFSGAGVQSESEKGRPYIRLFTAKQIINWRVTNGKTSLVVVHYQEPKESDDFDLQMIDCWIELRLIDGNACSRNWYRDGDLIAGEWVELKDANGNLLSELPWSWVGSMNNDHTPDAPPLADIAYVNIKHYQAEADIAESAHTVGQPMVALTGLNDAWIETHMKDGFTVGSRHGVLLPQNGDMKFAQPEERNIQITVAERREKQMAMLGAKLIERGTSARTATQAQNEAQTDNSILSLCAGNVEQAFNRALQFCIQFAGAGVAAIELNKSYEIAQLDSAAISTLLSAVQSGEMRKVDFIRYLQRINIVPQDESPEDIEDQLRNNEPEMLGR